MNPWLLAILAGFCFFLAVYLTFDFWYDRIWLKILRTRDEIVTVGNQIFVFTAPERVLRNQLLIFGFFLLIGFLLLSYKFLAGFCFLFPLINLFEDWLVKSPMSGFMKVVIRVGAALLTPFFIATFSGNFVTTFATMVPMMMIIILAYKSLSFPLIWYKHVVQPRRIQTFTVQLMDALTLMANGLKSGLNVSQAIQIVCDEMPKPIREEFGLVLNENKIGLTLESAFDNLAKRVNTEDVTMFVTSVNILRETGGNVAETFETICKTIRERLKLQAKIAAMTAQGMMSAIIVGAMPIGLGVMLYMIDPVTMMPLFTHPVGWGILMVILGLEVVGFFVILKVIKIRV